MRILYHHRTASRDGQAVHIDEMIHALRAIGHEVVVVGPIRHEGAAGSRSAQMGQKVGWVHRVRSSLPGFAYELLELGYSVPAWLRLRRIAREFKPDVIYERYNLHLLAGLWVSRERGVPLFLEVNAPLAEERGLHGGLALKRLAHWTEQQVWKGADRVFAVTQVLGCRVSAKGVQKGHIVITPNGINWDHFGTAPSVEQAKRSLGWSDALIVGFTGFVRDWHGVDRVVRWLASDAAPTHSRLLVVGDGPARAELEQLAQALGISDRVRFTGFVDRSEVPALVAAFDIALQPAVVDYASPLKLFEYLALGKAVIAPSQPNIREILTHGRNSVLFEPDRANHFGECLDQLARDSALRACLGAAARQTIEGQGLTWLHNARRIEQEAMAVLGVNDEGDLRMGAKA